MYLSAANEKIQVVLSGAVATNQLQCVASWQDITSVGMTLPQSSSQVLTNGITAVDLVGAPASSTNRQVTHINIFNSDTVPATITVQKDIAGTDYVLTKSLLQPNDTLQWSRESGWTILKQSAQESVILTEFTANGTWTKPAGLKRIIGLCVGAGGGGGSGRQGLAGENRYGGGGGGGGAVVYRMVASADLTSTVAVTIGIGGAGGAAQTAITTNGNTGFTGGDTSFGGLIIAKGGGGGGGGTTAAGSFGVGGSLATSVPSYSPFAIGGAGGGSGQTTANTVGSTGFFNSGGAGGGGGGGIASTNVSSTSANTGGGVYENGLLQAGPISGATPNGVDNVSTILFPSTTLNTIVGLGTGGAGNIPATPNAGNGGKGAGGGGGAGTLNGTNSGSGGNGGNGFCVIMEIY